MRELSAKQKLFVREYLVTLNATQAAIKAGYSAKTANEQAARMLAKVSVAAAIQKAMDQRLKKVEDKAEAVLDDVIRELELQLKANPNDLIEYRRTCCRCCYSPNGLPQHTVLEMYERRRGYKQKLAEFTVAGGNPEVFLEFDEEGGVGFVGTRAPNPECGECWGEGVGKAFLKDTRDLPPEALAVYAGVKITNTGLEVKMHDKTKAIELLGRHRKLFTDKLEVTAQPSLLQFANDLPDPE